MTTPIHAAPLLLEIWVNGRNTHIVAKVVKEKDSFKIANASLADAGLAVARAGEKVLNQASDIRAEEDEAGQRLLLTLAPSRLAQTVLDLRPSIVEDVTPAGRGASLGYTLSAQTDDVSRFARTSSTGAALSLTLFQDNARFVATGFATSGLSTAGARLDTSIEFDTPSAPRRIVIGDAVTGVPQWARAMRFGGIEIATDFSQQPDRITFPLPRYFGVASVPSTVDVFVGASHVFDAALNEGPFALNDLPVLTGGGNATVVMRDVLGRETRQVVSLYTDPTLLADGLTNYAFDAGFLRRNYGLSSADYATPFASLTWRRGFSGFTGELHGQFAPSLTLVSTGAAWTVSDFGRLSLDGAASHNNGRSGLLGVADFAARFGAVSFYGDVAATRGHFADLASLTGEDFPHLRYEADVSTALGNAGSLALGWIGERDSASVSSLITASYALSFRNGWYLGLTGLRDLLNRTWAAQLFFSLPLDGKIGSVSASAGSAGNAAEADYAKPVDPDGGFGYRLIAAAGNAGRVEADANWIGDRGEVDGAVASADGRTALRADVSGGLVLLDNRLFAARTPEGAVALVETGAQDVRVLRENRVVARTDADGDALITGLNPFAANRIGVDPRDYPIDTDVARSEVLIVPPRAAGVVVDLAPRARHSFIAVLKLPDGAYPPVGAAVDVENSGTPLIVGRDGEVFFGDLQEPAEIAVELPNSSCRATVVPPSSFGRIPRAGPFVCRKMQHAR